MTSLFRGEGRSSGQTVLIVQWDLRRRLQGERSHENTESRKF